MVNDSRAQRGRKRRGLGSEWKLSQLVSGAHPEEAFLTLLTLALTASQAGYSLWWGLSWPLQDI